MSSSLFAIRFGIYLCWKFEETLFVTARSIDIIRAFTAKEEIGGIDVNEDSMIPLALMQNAKGLAFLTVLKVGFIQSIKMGSGLVVARLSDGR